MMFLPKIGVSEDKSIDLDAKILEKILEPKAEYHPVKKSTDDENEEWHEEPKTERNKFKLLPEELSTEIHFHKNRVVIGSMQIQILQKHLENQTSDALAYCANCTLDPNLDHIARVINKKFSHNFGSEHHRLLKTHQTIHETHVAVSKVPLDSDLNSDYLFHAIGPHWPQIHKGKRSKCFY
jgi:hypothetical protein